MRRDCPRDRTPLVEQEHEIPGRNVKADHCPKCAGIFLDKNELARLTGQKNVNRLVTTYLGIDVGSTLVCPACGGLMDDEHFAREGEKITVDVCTTCQGLWLDAGELDAIAELDDGSFRTLTPEKRAEVFDQDMAEAQSASSGRNPLARALGSFAVTVKRGMRGLR